MTLCQMRPAGQGSGTAFFGKDHQGAQQAEKTKLKEIGSPKKVAVRCHPGGRSAVVIISFCWIRHARPGSRTTFCKKIRWGRLYPAVRERWEKPALCKTRNLLGRNRFSALSGPCPIARRALRSALIVLVILADDDSDIHRGVGVQVYEFEAG
jgi:hypothetical protein